jgi:hypothetical protein
MQVTETHFTKDYLEVQIFFLVVPPYKVTPYKGHSSLSDQNSDGNSTKLSPSKRPYLLKGNLFHRKKLWPFMRELLQLQNVTRTWDLFHPMSLTIDF